mmetsp:Transcript_5447/g.4134  ORF Transcript_5447/g.4134 Transcript_5447/m.4134 type:complete len:190 (+) Transcript_5447:120-689(+)
MLDKLNIFKLHGNLFLLFGATNLLCYGLSLFMKPDNYEYHFGYAGDENRMFKPFKAMVGSNNFWNIAWTAPSIIGLGFFLSMKFSSLFMTKFFFLTMFSSYLFMTAFNPTSGFNFRLLQHYMPRFDSYEPTGKYVMGADTFAQSLIYFTLLHYGLWYVALPFMVSDFLYYGPVTMGGPAAGLAAFLVLL